MAAPGFSKSMNYYHLVLAAALDLSDYLFCFHFIMFDVLFTLIKTYDNAHVFLLNDHWWNTYKRLRE